MTTGVFSAIGVVLRAARDLVDQFFAESCSAPARLRRREAHDDAADLTDEILCAAVGARLLTVEEAGEK